MSAPTRFALLGPVEAGKSTLFHALRGDGCQARKTQAVEYDGEGCLDTPGEFFSHPRLYHALINTIAESELLIYVHPANDLQWRMPPGLLEVNARQRVVAVISKIDLPDAQADAVEALLREQGFPGDILRVSSLRPDSVAALKAGLGLSNYAVSAAAHSTEQVER
ncbi:ethanolamine utilization protein EutP [Xenophilus sp. AP218F]|nr:EutP/PduV family microcompartment system protein [Chromobacterium sp. ASV5]OWY40298.1 ethanolamine utilization protein EutP [Xenophilus sp. AP218F]